MWLGTVLVAGNGNLSRHHNTAMLEKVVTIVMVIQTIIITATFTSHVMPRNIEKCELPVFAHPFSGGGGFFLPNATAKNSRL